jgi:hypothetical protein
LDGGHVEGFVKVLFPRVIQWSKGKGIVEEGFDNGVLDGRPSSVGLRRFDPPRGKWIRGGGGKGLEGLTLTAQRILIKNRTYP